MPSLELQPSSQGFSFSWVSRRALQSAVEKECVGVLSLVSFQLSCAFCRLLCFLPGFQFLLVTQIKRPGRLPVHTVSWSFLLSFVGGAQTSARLAARHFRKTVGLVWFPRLEG
ncbi:hypothetical protein KC19_9G119500 [Ceratodon purpureus]|uniref:Uncharacterized protein n=1 Tax=Ceratodon purpureus TaxID=3225 RepID=A0A8T0GUP0_CERPU|nr:hypothetical protein KC19_9G119500 [Ceratodon purpureus]